MSEQEVSEKFRKLCLHDFAITGLGDLYWTDEDEKRNYKNPCTYESQRGDNPTNGFLNKKVNPRGALDDILGENVVKQNDVAPNDELSSFPQRDLYDSSRTKMANISGVTGDLEDTKTKQIKELKVENKGVEPCSSPREGSDIEQVLEGGDDNEVTKQPFVLVAALMPRKLPVSIFSRMPESMETQRKERQGIANIRPPHN